MKKILSLSILLFVAGLFYAQTPTASQNYIYSKTYLSEDGSKKSEAVQYFDGLGRLKQTVSVKSTPSGKDLVVPVFYDELGRQPKDFLPLPITTANSGIQTVSEADINSYYGVANAFSEKVFDNSPLGKVLEVAAPGDAWKKGSGHTIQSQYETNVSADQVKKYVITSSWANATLSPSIPTVEWYTENQLMKNITIDEDGNKSIAFKNSQGQTVLARKMNGTTPVDTYYIYNIYDQLVLVITPKADVQISQNGNVVTQAILDQLCYQYKYDSKNRLVEKRLPGRSYWDYMVYDKQNRLILSQDARQHLQQWSFTKYDNLGRVVYTGLLANTSDRVSLQNMINSISTNAMNNESRTTTPFTANGRDVYYTNTAYPTGNMKVLTVNYYDDYAPGAPAKPATVFGKTTLGATPVQFSSNGAVTYRSLKGMPTSSYVKNIEDDSWSQSHIWYDTEGRAVGTHSINHLGGYTKTETELDFAGVPKQTKTYHKRLNTDLETQITETFTYDSQNRLLVHKHKVDSHPEEILAQNAYNDLGQLINKKVGNTVSVPLQSIDYQYNIRGWLTKINDPADLNGKLFGYEIRYNNPSNPSLSPARYNGNISEVDWRKNIEMGNLGMLKRYNYAYDKLNRLTQGVFSNPDISVPVNNKYDELISYDLNGNITQLKRNAPSLYGGTAELIDDLQYNYDGNRLISINDDTSNPSGYEGGGNSIEYDDNGNMYNHPDKLIDEISYNHLDLPNAIRINQNASKLLYLYRADGTKLRKAAYITSVSEEKGTTISGTVTEYLDGFHYLTTEGTPQNDDNPTEYAYEQEAFIAKLLPSAPTPQLQFFPTAEGFYDYQNNKYIYQYKDHLGNVRISYKGNANGEVEVTDQNDYYPFGMNFIRTADEEAYFGAASYKNYKFGSKELQESGMYDFGARMYMPDLGRWGVIDPLAESYRRWSPYHYAMNNPIKFTDPDGMGSYDENGVWHSEVEDFNNYHHIDWRSPDEKEYNTFKPSDEGGGGGSGGIFTSDKMLINFFQDFFLNRNGSVEVLFSLKEQVEKAGWNALKGPVVFEDADEMVKKIPALMELRQVLGGGLWFEKTNFFLIKGQSLGHKILLNPKNIINPLDLAYTIGHELNHSIFDYFENIFYETINSNKNSPTSRSAKSYFTEVISYSWQAAWGDSEIGSNVSSYVYKKHGPNAVVKEARHSIESIQRVNNNFNKLMSAWEVFYNNRKKNIK